MKKTVAILFTIFALTTIQAQENKFNLIVGTYTDACDSKGIYVTNSIQIREILVLKCFRKCHKSKLFDRFCG